MQPARRLPTAADAQKGLAVLRKPRGRHIISPSARGRPPRRAGAAREAGKGLCERSALRDEPPKPATKEGTGARPRNAREAPGRRDIRSDAQRATPADPRRPAAADGRAVKNICKELKHHLFATHYSLRYSRYRTL